MSYKPQDELQRDAKRLLDNLLARKEPLKPKDRLAIPPQDAPCQDPKERIRNQREVRQVYTPEQARLEAMRCLQCKNKPCVAGCPVHIDIPEFIKRIADGDNQGAINVIKQKSLLPAICGRVCPQEVQCQEPCMVGKALKDVDKAVGIGRLERFAADIERSQGKNEIPAVKPETGLKVAVVGSGPAGLVAAGDVRRQGHSVTILEAFHKTGGVMRYGIPEFRLPKEIVDQETETLIKMGVDIRCNFVVGRTRKLVDLFAKDHFDAVFLGTGAGLPTFLGIEGETLVGVFAANEYLTRANLMNAYDRENADTPIYLAEKVAVFGGGNVAMDAARVALRLGAREVSVIYRRTEAEMPARKEEIEAAMEEGVRFQFLQNAKRFIGNEKKRLTAMECLRYELGAPDKSGRPRPVAIPGSEFIMDLNAAIIAVGNNSNPLIKMTTPDLETNKWGNIIVNEVGKTSFDRVYAGGDIVLGAATVILAMGQGQVAAKAINEMLANNAGL